MLRGYYGRGFDGGRRLARSDRARGRGRAAGTARTGGPGSGAGTGSRSGTCPTARSASGSCSTWSRRPSRTRAAGARPRVRYGKYHGPAAEAVPGRHQHRRRPGPRAARHRARPPSPATTGSTFVTADLKDPDWPRALPYTDVRRRAHRDRAALAARRTARRAVRADRRRRRRGRRVHERRPHDATAAPPDQRGRARAPARRMDRAKARGRARLGATGGTPRPQTRPSPRPTAERFRIYGEHADGDTPSARLARARRCARPGSGRHGPCGPRPSDRSSSR